MNRVPNFQKGHLRALKRKMDSTVPLSKCVFEFFRPNRLLPSR